MLFLKKHQFKTGAFFVSLNFETFLPIFITIHFEKMINFKLIKISKLLIKIKNHE
jgi:hypothetical protein